MTERAFIVTTWSSEAGLKGHIFYCPGDAAEFAMVASEMGSTVTQFSCPCESGSMPEVRGGRK